MSKAVTAPETDSSDRARPCSKRYYTCEECGKSAKNRVIPADHDGDEYLGPQIIYLCNNHVAARYGMDIVEAKNQSSTQISK